jgi:NarL family two-component system sensor histidine kinase LiaS
LVEAEKLAQGAQRELTGILEQMRPASSLHVASNSANNARGKVEDFAGVLRETLSQWSRQNDIRADFQSDLLPEIPQSYQQAISRIVQEALSNILRHSNAKNVWFHIKMEDAPSSTQFAGCDSIFVLTIADDGDGFVVQNATGMGLTNMRERAEALPRGSFSLQSQRSEGTKLELRCCLETKPTDHE